MYFHDKGFTLWYLLLLWSNWEEETCALFKDIAWQDSKLSPPLNQRHCSTNTRVTIYKFNNQKIGWEFKIHSNQLGQTQLKVPWYTTTLKFSVSSWRTVSLTRVMLSLILLLKWIFGRTYSLWMIEIEFIYI